MCRLTEKMSLRTYSMTSVSSAWSRIDKGFIEDGQMSEKMCLEIALVKLWVTYCHPFCRRGWPFLLTTSEEGLTENSQRALTWLHPGKSRGWRSLAGRARRGCTVGISLYPPDHESKGYVGICLDQKCLSFWVDHSKAWVDQGICGYLPWP